jgi:hypothetical protein
VPTAISPTLEAFLQYDLFLLPPEWLFITPLNMEFDQWVMAGITINTVTIPRNRSSYLFAANLNLPILRPPGYKKPESCRKVMEEGTS